MKIELYTFGLRLRPCVGTGAAYVTLIASFIFKASKRAGVCLNICRGGLWVIDGSDMRGEPALRAGAVCKRGGKEPTSRV